MNFALIYVSKTAVKICCTVAIISEELHSTKEILSPEVPLTSCHYGRDAMEGVTNVSPLRLYFSFSFGVFQLV